MDEQDKKINETDLIQLWTEIAHNTQEKPADRLKASEFLCRYYGIFEKKEEIEEVDYRAELENIIDGIRKRLKLDE